MDSANHQVLNPGRAQANLITGKDLQEGFSFNRQAGYVPNEVAIEVKNNGFN